MTRLFRSKSCGLTEFNSFPPPTPFFHQYDTEGEYEEEEEEEEEGEDEEEELYSDASENPLSTPFIGSREGTGGNERGRNRNSNKEFAFLDIFVTALRKSLVTCSVERDDVSSSMDISWPTEVKHVSHVTFDRFNGFLGLPTELEPEVPRKVPSARFIFSLSLSLSLGLIMSGIMKGNDYLSLSIYIYIYIYNMNLLNILGVTLVL